MKKSRYTRPRTETGFVQMTLTLLAGSDPAPVKGGDEQVKAW